VRGPDGDINDQEVLLRHLHKAAGDRVNDFVAGIA